MKFVLSDECLDDLVARAADATQLKSITKALYCWSIIHPSPTTDSAYWKVQQLSPKATPELSVLWKDIKALRALPQTLSNYCEILHLGWRCAQQLGAPTLTQYHNLQREGVDQLYAEIRFRLQHLPHSSADELCNAVKTELHSIPPDPVRRHRFYIDEMLRVLSAVFQVEEKDGCVCFWLESVQHVVQLEHVSNTFGSQTCRFVLHDVVYHVILLGYPTSFYHELGHVVDDALSDGEDTRCRETVALILERLEPKPVLLFEALTTGFDYFVNDQSFPSVPSAERITQLFSNYLVVLFPSICPSSQDCFLLDSNLFKYTGALASYLTDYLVGQQLLPGSSLELANLSKVIPFCQTRRVPLPLN